MAASTCSVARPPMGPSQACGAIAIARGIGHGADFPERGDAADVVDVGLEDVDDAHLDQLAARVVTRSGVRRWRSGWWSGGRCAAMALTFSGGHGSSMNSRFSGSSSLTRTEATAGAGLGVEIDGDVDVGAERLRAACRAVPRRRPDLARGLRSTRNSRGAGLEAGDAVLTAAVPRSCSSSARVTGLRRGSSRGRRGGRRARPGAW